MTTNHDQDSLLNIVRETSDTLAGCRTRTDAFAVSLSQIRKMNDWDAAGISMFDDPAVSTVPPGPDEPTPLKLEQLPDHVTRRFWAGEPLFMTDEKWFPRTRPFEAGDAFAAYGILPLVIDGQLAGMIRVCSGGSEPIPRAAQNALILISRELSHTLTGLDRPGIGVQAESDIKALFDKQSSLLEKIDASLVVTDLSGIVTYWSPGAEKLYGYMQGEALGRSALDLVVMPAGADEEKHRIEDILLLGSWLGQYIQRRKDGSFFWADTSISLARTPGGEPAGFIRIALDITRQKKLENNLFETRKTLQMLVNSSPASLLLMDPEGRILTANQKMADKLDRPLNEIIGRNAYDLLPMFLGPSNRERIEKIIEANQGMICEDQRDGRASEHHFNPVMDDAGRVVCWAVSEIDLTERLNKPRKIEAIGSLAGGIAHDFNNILWAILGFAEMTLKDLPAGGSVRENVISIINASKRAKDLAEQVLTYSRQTGTAQTHVSLNSAIAETVKFIKQVLASSVTIQCNLPENECIIMANSTQIHQVILNICINARQALKQDRGGIRVALRPVCLAPGHGPCDGESKNREYACMTISNTGAGMDEAVIPQIFDPFSTTMAPGEVSGVGLSVVQAIIKDHHGFIDVENRPGRGALFIVYLPLCDGVPDEAEDNLITAATGNERILFVDDEDMLIPMTSLMRGRLGYDVVARSDPMEACIDFESDPDGFDLVILDYYMPLMTGLELADKIKAVRHDIPIILCTGDIHNLPTRLAERSFIKHILKKPVSIQEMATIIRRALEEGP